MPFVKPSSHPWDISLLVTIKHFLNVVEFDSLVSYLDLYTYSQRWDLSRLLMLNLYFLNLFSSFTHSQFSSVAQSCPTLCDPMYCSTPGLPVHHQLLELAQTHVHWVGVAIQPSHPLLSPSPPAFNLSASGSFPMSQFFASGGQSIGASALASVLPMNIQDWFPLG